MLSPSRYPQGLEDLIESVRQIPSSMLSAGGEPDGCRNGKLIKYKNQLHGFTVEAEEEIDYISRYGEEEGKHMQELEENRRREADVAREESYGEIKSEIGEKGIEALAWYTSFHFAPTKKRINPLHLISFDDFSVQEFWGIYIKESSLWYLAEKVFPDSGNLETRLELAYDLLYAHEEFHFLTDVAIAMWELITDRPLWAFDRYLRGRKVDWMSSESSEMGKRIEKPPTMSEASIVDYWLIEEQCANAYMLRLLEDEFSSGDWQKLSEFTKTQPKGYREALDAVEDHAFLPLLEYLLRQKLGPLSIKPLQGQLNENVPAMTFFKSDHSSNYKCPVYLVRDASDIGRQTINEKIIQAIPLIKESKKFIKSFKRLPANIQSRWEKKKSQLSNSVPSHPEFEKFSKGPPPVFSIRISRSVRAHLQQVDEQDYWEALDIGEHKKMGHG